MALNNLGDLLRARGNAPQAGPVYHEARVLFESLDPQRKYAPQGMVHNLGYVALAQGDVRHAASLFVEAAEIYLAVGSDRRGLAECMVGLGCTASRARRGVLAGRLFGAVEAELRRLGRSLTPQNQAERERGLGELATMLNAPGLDAAFAQGRALSLEQVLDEARELTRLPSHTSELSPPTRVAGLTAEHV